MLNENKRIEYVDILKGLGIILVILGHLEIPTLMKAWIYSFHMPMFFFLSGLVWNSKYNELSVRDFVTKKIRSLLWPYLTFSIIYLLYNILMSLLLKQFNLIKIIKEIIATLYSNYIFEVNYIGVLWFLGALFVVEILYFLISRFDDRRIRIALLILCVFLGHVCSILERKSFLRLPWELDIAFTAIVFFSVGASAHSIMRMLRKFNMRIIIGVAFLVSNIFFTYMNYIKLYNTQFIGRVDMLYLNYGNIMFFYISALSACIGFFLIFRNSKLYIFQEIGKKSLVIMALHIYLLALLQYFLKFIGGIFGCEIVLNWAVAFVCDLVISYVCATIIEKHFQWILSYQRWKQLIHKKRV
ncbi:acyltransferase family protein [Clostridium chromiireducens]|uniref:acyltransferase family protein n=1 Tax=Clostridium chromiireducens TaxID=225345 RepID=UPI003AF89792